MFSGGCMCRLSVPASVCAQRTAEGPLAGRKPELCLVSPRTPRSPSALILYATGDVGWLGASKVVFRHLAERGYPLVGINARDYLKNIKRDKEFISSNLLAMDLASIIDTAKREMGLPAAIPVILVGVSRGAEFMVVAAAQQSLQPRPAGAIALGLTRETDQVRDRRASKRRAASSDPSTMKSGQVLPYARLKSAYDIPISVIQSTNDRYLPAADARALFGPDTGMRRFRAVEARNHGFGGARDGMLRELDDALDWIESLMQKGAEPAAPPAPPQPEGPEPRQGDAKGVASRDVGPPTDSSARKRPGGRCDARRGRRRSCFRPGRGNRSSCPRRVTRPDWW
jgi:pimeloyl-ACP methyl ester carboxylesterase